METNIRAMNRPPMRALVVSLIVGALTHAVGSALPHLHAFGPPAATIQTLQLDHTASHRCLLCDTGPLPAASIVAASASVAPVIVSCPLLAASRIVTARRLSLLQIRGPPVA